MLIEALYILLIISLLLFLIWASFYSISLIFSWFSGAPYVATDHHDIKNILSSIPLSKNKYFLDLGCGDGRVLRYAALKYEINGKGIDINSVVLLKARFLSWFQKIRHIQYSHENVLETDMSKADVIYIFLFPKIIESLKEKLLNQTKKNVIIVSHAFKIPYLKGYDLKILKGNKFETFIYQKVRN